MCSVQNSKCILFWISKNLGGGTGSRLQGNGKEGILWGELEIHASSIMFPQSYGRESRRLCAVILLIDNKFDVSCPDTTFPRDKISS